MDFYLLDTPVSSKNAWQIEDWSLKKIEVKPQIIKNPNGTFSVSLPENLEPIGGKILEQFKDYKTPPKNTYIGEGILYKSAKLTDFISGSNINASINASGWVVNEKALKIVSQFNIGKYETYQFPLYQKEKEYLEYSFIAFNNKADDYVDFERSSFQLSDFMSSDDAITLIEINSKEDFYKKWKELQRSDDILFLEFNQIVFKSDFNQDLFCFQELPFTGIYASKFLVNRLKEEAITGMDFKQMNMKKSC
jgi:hypothetical protein